MKIKNKEVIQSYLITSAKYSFSIYEKRVLYRIIEIAQADINGKKLNYKYSINENLFKDKIIKIDLSLFKKDLKDKNYVQIKKALYSLNEKKIEYETPSFWKKIRIVEKPKIDKYGSFVHFEVQPEIWHAILNFNKGYSKYELETAMGFNSIYTMRFYEMFSNNQKPITLRIDTLKERFKIKNKYINRSNDFIRNVIETAKKELDKKSKYSFNYTTIKEGRKITMIKFVPTYIAANETKEKREKELQKQISLRHDFEKNILKYLNEIGFTNQGIKNNIKLFRQMNEKADLFGFIKDVSRNANKAKNPQGYVIGAMKTYLEKTEFEVKVNPKDREKMNNVLGGLMANFKV